MSDTDLQALARAAGLAPEWRDYKGQSHSVAPETLRAILTAMDVRCDSPASIRTALAQVQAENAQGLDAPLVTALIGESTPLPATIKPGRPARLVAEDGAPTDVTLSDAGGIAVLPAVDRPGYYTLESGSQRLTVAVAPRHATRVEDLAPSARPWGIAVQLYGLRRTGDGGLGDFTALSQFVRQAARAGADAVGISPVHAAFPADPNHYSPYSPSSRLFLNPLYADPAAGGGVEIVAALVERAGLRTELERLERAEFVDWAAVGRTRMPLFRALFAALQDGRFPDPGAADAFAAFRSRGGQTLEDHAVFDALHAEQLRAGAAWHWREWPGELRDPRSPAVARFARENRDAVAFYAFLQWLADRGLAGAPRSARDAGMTIGLITDLAVGTAGGGSHAWSRQHDMLGGVSVGAPPDDLNAQGQNWGLTTFSPRALRQHGYAPFIEVLRAALRHAGGVRIDHVLGLNRLWLVPDGAEPTAGAYMTYPLEDLLRLIALESWRHRAVIIGEDLGTVPEGFRARLAAGGLMGLRVLWFERDQGYFIEPGRYSTDAMATTSTHDTPTIAGWWTGRDIEWRDRLALRGETRPQRDRDRTALWAAFRHAGVADGPEPDETPAVVDAAVRFVAHAPAPLTMIPLEDVVGLDEQPNLPGTVDEHPNWRRRLPGATTELLAAPAAERRLAAVRAARSRK